MKTIKYAGNPNYKTLLNFISKSDYEVFIIGHSCGMSDKTLLKELFENPLCKSIKLYYYDDKDLKDKQANISRLAKDKMLMRNKLDSAEKLYQE